MSADRKISRRDFLKILGGAVAGYAVSELTKPKVAGLGNTVKPVLTETVVPSQFVDIASEVKKDLAEEEVLRIAGQLLHEKDLNKVKALDFKLNLSGSKGVVVQLSGDLAVKGGKVDYSSKITEPYDENMPVDISLVTEEKKIPGTDLMYSFSVVKLPSFRYIDSLGSYGNWITNVIVSKPDTDRKIVFRWNPFSENSAFSGVSLNTEYGLDPIDGDPTKKFPLFIDAISNNSRVDGNVVVKDAWGWDKNRLAIDSLAPVAKEWGGIINSDDRFWDKVEIHPDNQKSRAEQIEYFVTKNGSIINFALSSKF